MRNVAYIGALLGAIGLAPACLGGCESKGGASPEDAANAAEAWLIDGGVKGEVRTSAIRCQGDGGRYRCEGAVKGGGTLPISGVFAGGQWRFEIAEPVVVVSLVEDLIRKQHADLGVIAVPSCGDRVRPSKKGDQFKCLIRDADGKEVSAAEVTVTDAEKAMVNVKRLTEVVDRKAVEAKVQTWLGENDVTGNVRCPPPQRHFSLPDTTFICDVEGIDRGVKVTVTDYRGSATLGWAPE